MKGIANAPAIGVLALAVWMIGPPGRAETINHALGKPVTCNGFYSGLPGEVFPCENVNDGRIGDTGASGDWSFWLLPNFTTGHFILDLETVATIDFFELQNTHNRRYNDRATKDFRISLSLDNAAYVDVVDDQLAFETPDISVVRFDIEDRAARYVRFDVDSWWDVSSSTTNGGAGLNEIWVWGEPVPEPSILLGLLGLAAAGLPWAWRRRRR